MVKLYPPTHTRIRLRLRNVSGGALNSTHSLTSMGHKSLVRFPLYCQIFAKIGPGVLLLLAKNPKNWLQRNRNTGCSCW